MGKNPKNGGNPPNDKKDKNKENLINELLLNKTNIWFTWKRLKLLNKNTIVAERKQ